MGEFDGDPTHPKGEPGDKKATRLHLGPQFIDASARGESSAQVNQLRDGILSRERLGSYQSECVTVGELSVEQKGEFNDFVIHGLPAGMTGKVVYARFLNTWEADLLNDRGEIFEVFSADSTIALLKAIHEYIATWRTSAEN